MSMKSNPPGLGRRALIRASAGLGVAAMLPAFGPIRPARGAQAIRLSAAPGRAQLAGPGYQATEVWCYDGQVPGPILRFRQGERARIVVDNRLPLPTTVHWHGLRVPNAMDGVPDVTQAPIPPGGAFVYEFDLEDAGTFWYHPHVQSMEQVGRGLSGAFIVDEEAPPPVDRDLVWVLADWRLTREAAIQADFGNPMDMSHAGRLGNTVTLNGGVPGTIGVRAGERLRLRLINAANARIFALAFQGQSPVVIARDGQPIDAHAPEGGRVVLGPGQRADVIVDVAGASGQSFPVVDSFFPRQSYKLVDLVCTAAPPLGPQAPPGPPPRLAANPLPEPELGAAERHAITFGGGMMDPNLARAGGMAAMMERMRSGAFWTVNGVAHADHGQPGAPKHPLLLTLRQGRSCILELANETAWHHPIHLHGTAFRVLTRAGAKLARPEWADTILMAPGERVEIAFLAELAGDWMLHCHILEHQESGMMGIVRIV